jgi:hypothetical protein
MAITNWHQTLRLAALALCWGSLAAAAYDAPQASLAARYIRLADRQLAEARKTYAKDTNRVSHIWQLGRALFFRAEFASGESRERLAVEGIDLCERGLARHPGTAELHYYLALNQGQLAREKLFGALGLVRRMREHLLEAAASKPLLDRAGPDRCLALLHRDAPGWPISVGNRKTAVHHLAKACQLAPTFPENLIVQLESWLKWGQTDHLPTAIQATRAALGKARKELTGEEWEPYHDDWNARWSDILDRAAKHLRE